MLNNLSEKLDSATIEVFKCLDQIKKDNIVENKPQVEKVREKSLSSIQTSVKTFTNNTSKSINTTTANSKKSTVITSSTKDDDEWESF